MDMTVGLMPLFGEKLKDFVIAANTQGLSVDVQSGLRTIEEQTKLYAQGRTTSGNIITNAKPWYSWHNYGVAADVVFKSDTGGWTWDVPDQEWHILAGIAKSYGLEWGGDFKTIKDEPHFQLTGGLTIAEALAVVQTGFYNNNVWDAIEDRLNG